MEIVGDKMQILHDATLGRGFRKVLPRDAGLCVQLAHWQERRAVTYGQRHVLLLRRWIGH